MILHVYINEILFTSYLLLFQQMGPLAMAHLHKLELHPHMYMYVMYGLVLNSLRIDL